MKICVHWQASVLLLEHETIREIAMTRLFSGCHDCAAYCRMETIAMCLELIGALPHDEEKQGQAGRFKTATTPI
jgi:hypothetical protein